MSDDESSGGQTFADWFTSLPGRDIYTAIPVEFFEDDFNVHDAASISNFDFLLEIILTDVPPDDEIVQADELYDGLVRLYELIHQKYILTRMGLHDMYCKFLREDFGRCPRTLCDSQPTLPVGTSTRPGQAQLKLYCPHCQDLYTPPSRRHASLDGCGFGPTFAHLLILQYRDHLSPWISSKKDRPVYVPRIFGFKIHHTSPLAHQMGWLRDPSDGYR